ncbi:MAG TPA: DUF1080 domain-containing protein [Pirellulales bacterium]|jgi:hypothetical protein
MFRMLASTFALTIAFTSLSFSVACADDKGATTFTDPAKAGADFEIQGEYVGEHETSGGKEKVAFQIIALGNGKFDSVVFLGGLPGDGWKPEAKPHEVVSGEMKDGAAVFSHKGTTLKVSKGVATASGNEKLEFKRVERKSPTLGAKPPEGATVLFDGKSAEGWYQGKLTPDGLLAAGCLGKKDMKDFKLHLEFQTPFMPTARGQGRGNSGVYLQNRYELQVLDSFGLEGKDNECGGFYSIKAPAVNMCFPPLAWQTYDIDFKAARFDDTGKKTANAVVTVLHNGVPIYEKFELPAITPGGQPEKDTAKPLQLQDHGNPVRYRNIWMVEPK